MSKKALIRIGEINTPFEKYEIVDLGKQSLSSLVESINRLNKVNEQVYPFRYRQIVLLFDGDYLLAGTREFKEIIGAVPA